MYVVYPVIAVVVMVVMCPPVGVCAMVDHGCSCFVRLLVRFTRYLVYIFALWLVCLLY